MEKEPSKERHTRCRQTCVVRGYVCICMQTFASIVSRNTGCPSPTSSFYFLIVQKKKEKEIRTKVLFHESSSYQFRWPTENYRQKIFQDISRTRNVSLVAHNAREGVIRTNKFRDSNEENKRKRKRKRKRKKKTKNGAGYTLQISRST